MNLRGQLEATFATIRYNRVMVHLEGHGRRYHCGYHQDQKEADRTTRTPHFVDTLGEETAVHGFDQQSYEEAAAAWAVIVHGAMEIPVVREISLEEVISVEMEGIVEVVNHTI